MTAKGQLNRPFCHEWDKALNVIKPGFYGKHEINGEKWKEVVVGGNVLVSPLGEVAVLTGTGYRVLEQQDIGGYLAVWLRLTPGLPDSSAYLLHRLVARKWVPITTSVLIHDPENGLRLDGQLQVDHFDKNPFNNYADNLEWVTAEENRRRKYGGYIPEVGITIDVDCLPVEERRLVS